MTQMCYLARPIDLDGDRGYAEWIADQMTSAMGQCDLVAYNPSEAFLVPPGARPNASVAQINNLALGQCRGMIVLFPERPSIGVGLELQMAQQQGLPILVITTLSTVSRSWSLAGLRGAHIMAVPGEQSNWRLSHNEQMLHAVQWLNRQAAALDLVATRSPIHPLKVVLDSDDCSMMTRSYRGDAGFDLYTSEETWVEPGAFIDVPCGLSVQLPPGYWGFIVGRSSTLRKHRLLVVSAVIDNGYRGPLFVGVQNMGFDTFTAKAGMRLAQLIPMPLAAADMVQTRVDRLDPSDRGSSGFGSSGE